MSSSPTHPPADDAANPLRSGEYARKQLFGRGLIGWSHGRRFAEARRVVQPYAGASLLDYGCGDGTFLALVHDRFPRAVGAEIDPGLVAGARERFGAMAGLSFIHTDEVAALPDGSFGVVTCMEVLEHCTAEAAERVIAQLRRLVARDGVVIVSVPVETGPALLVKQAARAVAGLRGVSGYQERERYAPGELARMVFAGSTTAIDRPVYETRRPDGTPNRYHGHKGFNWRMLAARLERDFTLRETHFSPVPALGAALNSQAWFTCVPR
ncbi:MAG TPA: class I SAM-dependent methyltransferase [Longimicrobium sp.]|nr:class I SAM-dependent methyltransferase [Longimicrobium sp.]